MNLSMTLAPVSKAGNARGGWNAARRKAGNNQKPLIYQRDC
jgi:hypothetical protein